LPSFEKYFGKEIMSQIPCSLGKHSPKNENIIQKSSNFYTIRKGA
jgi:hypothetical protein